MVNERGEDRCVSEYMCVCERERGLGGRGGRCGKRKMANQKYLYTVIIAVLHGGFLFPVFQVSFILSPFS